MTVLTRRLPWFLAWFTRQAPAGKTPTRSGESPPVAREAATDDPRMLEERRGEAMRRLFPKRYSWCSSRADWIVALEVHDYLAAATNVTDLENRIHAVEKRRHFGI